MGWLGNVGQDDEVVSSVHVIDKPCVNKHNICLAMTSHSVMVEALTVEGVSGVGAVIDRNDDDTTGFAETRRPPSCVSERVRTRLPLFVLQLLNGR